MNKFEYASENLMEKIREGKESVLSYRGEIQKDKYEEIFERLDDIDLTPENIKKERIKNLEKLIKELKDIIDNENYTDKVRMMKLLMLIDINRNNLKYIFDDKKEIIEYEQSLTNIKKILEIKIAEKTTSYCKAK